jgi:hypothetical protein
MQWFNAESFKTLNQLKFGNFRLKTVRKTTPLKIPEVAAQTTEDLQTGANAVSIDLYILQPFMNAEPKAFLCNYLNDPSIPSF